MKWRKYLYGYLAFWLAFPCMVFFIWLENYNLLIGTRGTAFLIQSILNGIAAVCGITLAVLQYLRGARARKNKAVLALVTAAVVVLLLCGNFSCRCLNGTEEYHSFTSPDGSHTIVMAENVSLVSGQVVLYERVNPFLIAPREQRTTDDGCRPICAGEYSLIWDGDTVTVLVSDGAGGTETISAALGEG